MIFLLAGTAETRSIASGLVDAGLEVTVSTATDFPIELHPSKSVSRRVGRLTAEEMIDLCKQLGVGAIVDATHPYAEQVQKNAIQASSILRIKYFRYDRPGAPEYGKNVHVVSSHEQAACLATSFKKSILLTSGTNNLHPYVERAKTQGVELYVRALDCGQSRKVVMEQGIDLAKCEFGVGPFSLEDNLRVLRKFGIGVLVTKDGGIPGGLPDKLKAAEVQNCEVIVISRPNPKCHRSYNKISDLIDAVRTSLSR
ncbi:MAG: precorrin-6A reductase [Syntrophaceae bacterium]|nr:precorrin-6A reductase [Syntrophaceae bacterium]